METLISEIGVTNNRVHVNGMPFMPAAVIRSSDRKYTPHADETTIAVPLENGWWVSITWRPQGRDAFQGTSTYPCVRVAPVPYINDMQREPFIRMFNLTEDDRINEFANAMELVTEWTESFRTVPVSELQQIITETSMRPSPPTEFMRFSTHIIQTERYRMQS